MPVREDLSGIIAEFSDVFALTDSELGRALCVQHEIDTGDARPIRQRPRPVPLPMKDQVKALLKRMKEQGIVKPSNSPWASPCVLVRKKFDSVVCRLQES